MSVNRYHPHLIVLPEDRANEEIVNGFIQSQNVNNRTVCVERPAGGWLKAVTKFETQIIPDMQKYKQSLVILIIDFDKKNDRLSLVKGKVPKDLSDRVFILGIFTEPEDLKKMIQKQYEKIGETLADDCPDSINELWEHDLLKHNKNELDRVIKLVRPFLFSK